MLVALPFLLFIALTPVAVYARPSPLRAMQQQLFHIILRSPAPGVYTDALPPVYLSSSTATSLSVVWDSTDADTYRLYADSWWAADGVEQVVYTGENTADYF